ncbi:MULTISPECIES: multidrug effflux MFS transporter [Actinosynnema]|uniref:multidrug effflux MFS transporter n=1 Tax=Actinosynnema TaxID=40566 RepID=UPI0020A4DC0C|nr:multidrug effflux MFS transporter [Actinosynnema pretiosum]
MGVTAVQGRGKLVALLGVLCCLGPLSIDAYLPAFPDMAKEFGAGESQIQLSLTTFIIGLSVGQLLIGPLSDSIGRRKPLLFGIGSYVVLSLVCALAPTATALAAFRLLQGLGVAAGFVVAMAVARDRFSGLAMAKFMSLIMLVNGLGPMLAPVLGGQVLRYASWRATFVVLAVVAVVLLVLMAVGLKETLPPEKRRPLDLGGTLRVFGGLLTDRVFVGYVLASAFALGAIFGYVSGSSFVLQGVFGLSPQEFSLVFALNSGGIFIAGVINTALTGRIMPRGLLRIGLSTAVAAGIALVVAGLVGGGLVTFLVPLFLVTCSIGLLMPNAATLAMARHPEAAGSSSALLGVSQFLMGGLMAPVVGAGGSSSVLPLALVMAACTALALTSFLVLTRGDKGITKDEPEVVEPAQAPAGSAV